MTGTQPHLALPQARGNAGSARSEAAYAHLKHRLLEGDLTAGNKISVVEVTRALDCSRVPVMEALKRLESEGFIRIVPQVGCRVVTPVPADVRDFFSLFAAVEGTVTRLAAERRDAREVADFESTCDSIDAALADAAPPGEPDPTYRRLNLLFHSHIHRMARSPVTTAIASSLWDRSDFYIKLAFGSLYFSRRVREAHAAIRRAIAAGDGTGAGTAIASQLEFVGEAVAAALERQAGLSN
ncbi:MAG: GntR family transcriptional regulator [Gammaproteobacteria bacterium]